MQNIQYLRRIPNIDISAPSLNVMSPGVHRALDEKRLTGNAEDVQARWENDKDIVFLLFLLFIFFGLFFLTIRVHCFWRNRVQNGGDPRNHETPAQQHSGQPGGRTKPRSQEFIEKMLVLKKAFWVTPDDKQLDKSRGMKSNIIVDSGKDADGNFCCSICLGEYEDGDKICWSNNSQCTHHFHAACGIAWLAKHSDCPICRAEYLVSPDTEKDGDLKETSNSNETDQQVATSTAQVQAEIVDTLTTITPEAAVVQPTEEGGTSDISLSVAEGREIVSYNNEEGIRSDEAVDGTDEEASSMESGELHLQICDEHALDTVERNVFL